MAQPSSIFVQAGRDRRLSMTSLSVEALWGSSSPVHCSNKDTSNFGMASERDIEWHSAPRARPGTLEVGRKECPLAKQNGNMSDAFAG